MLSKIIKSISYNQEEIIKNIINLHINGPIELDPTYSKGNFYKNIPKPLLKFDINPQTSNTIKADCTRLPLRDNSLLSIMYDPPFLATKGKSLSIKNQNNIIAQRFGVFETEEKLFEFYRKSLTEFYRVLKQDGILVVKCQDKVSGGKQYFSHCFIYNESVKIGFYPLDLFILLAKTRLVANWQRNQQHARKYHSYFWVFIK